MQESFIDFRIFSSIRRPLTLMIAFLRLIFVINCLKIILMIRVAIVPCMNSIHSFRFTNRLLEDTLMLVFPNSSSFMPLLLEIWPFPLKTSLECFPQCSLPLPLASSAKSWSSSFPFWALPNWPLTQESDYWTLSPFLPLHTFPWSHQISTKFL